MGSLSLSPIGGKSVVDTIVDRITGAITSGDIGPGDRIPTEMELCESLGVGRNSVREAMKVLESMGIVDIRRAEGTFVATGFHSRMLDPVVYGLLLNRGPAEEIIEIRRIFEYGALRLAAINAQQEDLDRLQDRMEDIRRVALQSPIDEDALHEADIRFHAALGLASHNSLIINIGQIVERVTGETRRNTVNVFASQKGGAEYIRLHEEIVQMVRERNLEPVQRIIEEHFEDWSRSVYIRYQKETADT